MRNLFYLFLFPVLFLFAGILHAEKPLTLSLEEAILLSVRQNPNMQTIRLSHVISKFSLWVQQWEFYPHYSFTTSVGAKRDHLNHHSRNGFNFDAKPSISLLTPIGTQLTLSATNAKSRHYTPGLSLTVVQPLLRGFGKAVVEAALHDAKDSELISRLRIEDTLRQTVTTVINAYLDVMMANETINIDKKALSRAENSVKQTQLFIKAGHKAGNDLVTVQANVATARTQLENDKNNLEQAKYALLTAIGLDPNTPVVFSKLDIDALINKYRLPALQEAKRLILQNDIQYQIDQITLHGSNSRALLKAVDNTRWKLNLTASAGRGGGRGFHNLWYGLNHSKGVALELDIPIDNQAAKQGVVNAKIALKQAEIALLKEKWDKETGVINGWNSVVSAKRALGFAEDAEKLQERTYQLSFQKYLHGLIDSLELQSAQVQLIAAQQTLLSARVNYLKALVSLDRLIGRTLITWNVQVRV